MPGGQGHDRGLQPGPKHRSADPVGQPGAGPRAAVPAAQLVRAMLGHDHTDRRQLRDLMAAEPAARPALLPIEPMSASATRLRIVIDDLIDLILGFELATRAGMPLLPTGLATPAFPAHQLLGLRPGLRPPLRSRLRRIHRRRPGTRARILPRQLLQPPQPILDLLNPRGQLANELNTRNTPRVVDRLRLGTIHTCKIRCTNKESLPQTPTTERLRIYAKAVARLAMPQAPYVHIRVWIHADPSTSAPASSIRACRSGSHVTAWQQTTSSSVLTVTVGSCPSLSLSSRSRTPVPRPSGSLNFSRTKTRVSSDMPRRARGHRFPRPVWPDIERLSRDRACSCSDNGRDRRPVVSD